MSCRFHCGEEITMANNYREELQRLIEQLQVERDQINVKLHLAKAELRDEWAKVERQWDGFRQKSERVFQQFDHVEVEVKTTLKQLGEELKESYRRIRRQL
jgi:thioesterase domain-containing protein